MGAFANAKSIEGSTIEKMLFTKYCVNTPEVVSWMEFYADIVETSKPLDASNDKKCERVIAALGAVTRRTTTRSRPSATTSSSTSGTRTRLGEVQLLQRTTFWRRTHLYSHPEF